GRELSRLFAISILIASRTAERLTVKVSAHLASFGKTLPGGQSPRTIRSPISWATEECTLEPASRELGGESRRSLVIAAGPLAPSSGAATGVVGRLFIATRRARHGYGRRRPPG